MEILRPGSLERDSPLSGECWRCRCRVRCEQDESTWMRPAPYAPECRAVECPTLGCDGIIYLDTLAKKKELK